jgi:hypothetical protein
VNVSRSGARSTVVILSGASDANQSISRTLVNAAKKDIFSLASGVAERRHWMKETIQCDMLIIWAGRFIGQDSDARLV